VRIGGTGAQSRQHVSRPRSRTRPDVWCCSFFYTRTGTHTEATATSTRSCECTSLAKLASLLIAPACHGGGGRLEVPKHLARTVHDLYFKPKYEEFQSRTIWSLPIAFTSAFKELDPVPQFRATAKLGEFLEGRFSQAF